MGIREIKTDNLIDIKTLQYVAGQTATLKTVPVSTGNSDSISITTGNNSGAGNSGNITVSPGTVGGGTRGKFKINDGSNTTTGWVWTLTNTDGSGAWMAGGGGGGSTFLDNAFRIQDNGDVTKQLAFEVSAISTATTRTWLVPDVSLDFSLTTSGTFATNTLNNLGTTSVNANLIPDSNASRDLGTTTVHWNAIYTGNNVELYNGINQILRLSPQNQTTPTGATVPGLFNLATGATGNQRGNALGTANDGNNDANGTGVIRLETGNKTSGTGTSGLINIQTGTTSGGANTGTVNIQSGNVTTNVVTDTGSVTLKSGSTTSTNASSDSGAVTVASGNSTTGNSGSLFLTVGTAGGTRGSIALDSASVSSTGNISVVNSASASVSVSDSNTDPGFDLYGNLTSPSGATNTGGLRSRSTVPSHLAVFTSNDTTANASATKSLLLESGNKTAGTGNSGDIGLTIGTSSGGTRGKIRLKDGSEGTAGYVWTSTDTTGGGAWMAGGSSSPGGANTNIQFNDGGVFGGNSGLVYDKTRKSVAIGATNTVNADNSLAAGTSNTISSGADQSFASGNANSIGANTNNSHVEGYNNIIGSNLTTVHAEGNSNTVNGTVSHAEGYGNTTTVAADRSHVEGENSRTENVAAHAEGSGTKASGVNSHSEGSATVASGNNSHAAGEGTTAQGYSQTTIGRFNVLQGTSGSFVSGDESFIVGNGTSNGSRHNAFSITNDAIVKMYGTTSGFFGQKAAATTTSYNVIWPSAQGAASTFLQNDGAGNLSWSASGGSGANQTLSNLTGPTAINADLIFAHDTGDATRYVKTADSATTTSTDNLRIKSGDFSGSGGFSGNIEVGSGDSTEGSGGVSFHSGTVGVSFNSGSVTIYSESTDGASSGTMALYTGNVSNAGQSGDMSIVTGDTDSNNSGTVLISSGQTNSSTSGTVQLKSGQASAPTGNSGATSVLSGIVVDGTSGPVNVETGLASGTGNSGDASLSSGTVQGGPSGAVSVFSGDALASGGSSGAIFVASGSSVDSSSGAVDVKTGDAGGGSGFLTLASGGSSASSTGNVIIKSGDAPTSSTGNLAFNTGTPGTGNTSGNMDFNTGATDGAVSGHFIANTGGVSGNANSGNVGMSTGPTDLSTSGSASLITGGSNSGNSGNAFITTGDSAGSGLSGTIFLTTGEIDAGTSGNVTLTTGPATTRGKIKLDGREVDVSSKNVTNVADPVNAQDAATKNFVYTETGVWKKYVINYNYWTAAALTDTENLFVLAAGEEISRILIKHTTEFSGGTVTAATVSVGKTGSNNEYTSDFDVFQTVGGTAFQQSEANTIEDFGGTTQITVTLNTVGDNISNLTAGVVSIWVKTTKYSGIATDVTLP